MEGRRAVRVAAWGLVGLGVVVLLALVAWLIWKVPPALYAYVPEPKDRANAEALTRTGIIAGLAGLAALGSLAMTTWMTTRTYRLTQQGQLTDLYTKAIEQLGSDKLDVRLGGIYALERIAVDSTRDHPTIVEVLSAFIRDRTALLVRPRPGRAKKLGVDVQGALTVLGRLPSRRGISRGDLPRVSLPSVILSEANFTAASFFGADLNDARARRVNLTRARLIRADLGGARLTAANLFEANLTEAQISFANLTGANLLGADLTRAKLLEADLTGAQLGMANLTGAELLGANLTGAELLGANLTGAELGMANLTAAKVTQKQLDAALGDNETTLPAGLTRPERW